MIMHIQINNQTITVSAEETLEQVLIRYCANAGMNIKYIAVAIGKQVIPRPQWSSVVASEYQEYTVFSAVAGG